MAKNRFLAYNMAASSTENWIRWLGKNNLSIDFAFKRLSLSAHSLPDDEALYRALVAEISVLGPILVS